MVSSPDFETPDLLEVMSGSNNNFAGNEARRTKRIQIWKTHLQGLQEYLMLKMDLLEKKLCQQEAAVAQAQTELHTLIKQNWRGEAANE